MKDKLLNLPVAQLLTLVTLMLLAFVVLAVMLLIVNAPSLVLQTVLIALAVFIVFSFVLVNRYIAEPISSLHKYLLGQTSELPKLIALDLNKELSDIVYEVNNLQSNLSSQSSHSNKQTQALSTNEDNASFFSKALIEHVDEIQRTCKQIQYRAENKTGRQDDLKKDYKKIQTKLVRLINKQKNNVEFLHETKKILKQSEKLVLSSETLVDKSIKQIHDVKKAFLDFEAIAERVNELSFKANLLAINTQLETTKLGAKGQAFKQITKEWQQLAAYNVQTSNQCKLFSGSSKTNMSNSADAITDLKKQLLALSAQLGEGVMNTTTDISEADTVLKTINLVQKEADLLDKKLFDKTETSKEIPTILNKATAIKQTLKAWNSVIKEEN